MVLQRTEGERGARGDVVLLWTLAKQYREDLAHDRSKYKVTKQGGAKNSETNGRQVSKIGEGERSYPLGG